MKREGIPGDPEVGRRVKMARAGADSMSQAELASQCAAILNHPGVSRTIISRIESADRDAESRLLAAISVATGVEYDWLNEPIRAAATVNEAKGAYLTPASATRDYLRSNSDNRYVYPDWHPINLHVRDEWHYRDEIPGQTEFVINLRDDALAETRVPLAEVS